MTTRNKGTHLSNQFRYDQPISRLMSSQTQITLKNEEKNEDVFFKSQVSLAETCQDQKNVNYSFGVDLTDEDSLSMHSKSQDDTSLEVEICQDFFLKGCCMKGQECSYIHISPSCYKIGERNRKIRAWFLREIPEIFLVKWKRINSFLN